MHQESLFDVGLPVPRVMDVFFPLWALRQGSLAKLGTDEPECAALIHQGMVVQVSAGARDAGVQLGMRLREAQTCAPHLHVIEHNPALAHKNFDPVLEMMRSLVPHLHVVEPGHLVLSVGGPARFFGSEQEAAEQIAHRLAEEGHQVGVGIADGRFTAHHASRQAAKSWQLPVPATPIKTVVSGGSAAYLANVPLSALSEQLAEKYVADLVRALQSLGLHTLREFAAMPSSSVLARFGPDALPVLAMAQGRDERPVLATLPVQDFSVSRSFEPGLDRVDQVIFAFKGEAEKFIQELHVHNLVCTSVEVVLSEEDQRQHSQVWNHPRYFRSEDLLERLRWQLRQTGGAAGDASSGTSGSSDASGAPLHRSVGSAIVQVTFNPVSVAPFSAHHSQLWEQASSQKVHQSFSRIQGLLGHHSVLSAHLAGGRLLTERVVMLPWGEKGSPEHQERIQLHSHPWPGALDAPTPLSVSQSWEPVEFYDGSGHRFEPTERGGMSGTPHFFVAPGVVVEPQADRGNHRHQVAQWSALWPLTARSPLSADAGWEQVAPASSSSPEPAQRATMPTEAPMYRMQVVDTDGLAWLLLFCQGQWFIEGQYE